MKVEEKVTGLEGTTSRDLVSQANDKAAIDVRLSSAKAAADNDKVCIIIHCERKP